MGGVYGRCGRDMWAEWECIAVSRCVLTLLCYEMQHMPKDGAALQASLDAKAPAEGAIKMPPPPPPPTYWSTTLTTQQIFAAPHLGVPGGRDQGDMQEPHTRGCQLQNGCRHHCYHGNTHTPVPASALGNTRWPHSVCQSWQTLGRSD